MAKKPEDVPIGTGGAQKAKEAKIKRKKRNDAALKAAMDALRTKQYGQ